MTLLSEDKSRGSSQEGTDTRREKQHSTSTEQCLRRSGKRAHHSAEHKNVHVAHRQHKRSCGWCAERQAVLSQHNPGSDPTASNGAHPSTSTAGGKGKAIAVKKHDCCRPYLNTSRACLEDPIRCRAKTRRAGLAVSTAYTMLPGLT